MTMPQIFTHEDVTAALNKVNAPSQKSRVRFSARCQNLIRLWAMPGASSKKRKSFTDRELCQMAIAAQLMECGLSPNIAAKIVKSNWQNNAPHDGLQKAFQNTFGQKTSDKDENMPDEACQNLWMKLSPSMASQHEKDTKHLAVTLIDSNSISYFMSGATAGTDSRLILINLSATAKQLSSAISAMESQKTGGNHQI